MVRTPRTPLKGPVVSALDGKALAARRLVLEGELASARHRRLRSSRFNVGYTFLLALLVVALPRVSSVSGSAVAGFAVVAWLLYETATLAYLRRGMHSRLYRALATLDAVFPILAAHALLFLSESLLTPLWVISMGKAFVPAEPDLRLVRAERLALGLSLSALFIGFVGRGELEAALFVGLAAGTIALAHTTTLRVAQRSIDVQAERDLLVEQRQSIQVERERDRLARELHDGVGADVTALVLQLRMLADDQRDEELKGLQEQAQQALRHLRHLVQALRSGEP